MSKLRIVAISDTHGLHRSLALPAGDILVHTGDLTRYGREEEVADLNDWFGGLAFQHILVIAGNHDWCFAHDASRAAAWLTHAHYLQDSSITLHGITFYGSPWQPEFGGWAFNLPRGPQLKQVWARIPSTTDVLLTHCPPFGIQDRNDRGTRVGCRDLAARLQEVKPRLHVFGHIHEAYGVSTCGQTTYVNASSCTLDYQPINPALLYLWDSNLTRPTMLGAMPEETATR